MSKRAKGYTKQGVRNLDDIGPRKSAGRVLPTPPKYMACIHVWEEWYQGYSTFSECVKCHELVEH